MRMRVRDKTENSGKVLTKRRTTGESNDREIEALFW